MKHYYRVISFTPTYTDRIWHCSHDTALALSSDYIIPLDRKPRNIEIKEGN